MAASVVDQNLTHLLRGDRKKMGATLPLRRMQPDQADIDSIDQSGALHCVVGPLPAQLKVS